MMKSTTVNNSTHFDRMCDALKDDISRMCDNAAEKYQKQQKVKKFYEENRYDVWNIVANLIGIVSQIFITKHWNYDKRNKVLTFLLTGGVNYEQAEKFKYFYIGVKLMDIAGSVGRLLGNRE